MTKGLQNLNDIEEQSKFFDLKHIKFEIIKNGGIRNNTQTENLPFYNEKFFELILETEN